MELSTMVRVRQAALVALISALALTLQGCFEGGTGGGSCEPMEFSGGSVAKAGNGRKGVVTCDDDGTNGSPDLTCNWVGVACEAAKDDERQCRGLYAFGLKDTGLKEWPVDKAPEKAGAKFDSGGAKFTVGVANDAIFASAATKAAGMSRSEKLKKWAVQAKAKAGEAAAAAKEHGSKLAAAAKEKGSKALAAAKGDDAKGDDAKGDDAKGGDAKGDDAKGGDAKEAKARRLGDDAKGGDAKGADAKGADAKDAPSGIPIKKSELKCAAAEKAAPAKDDAKGKADAKGGDAKGKADAKGKDTKLFSVNGKLSSAASHASSGWVTPVAGCFAVAGVALAAMKVARSRSARSRSLDTRPHDEESSQEAIE